ncbi:ATP-binding protein [Desulfobacterota bacterium M19]
MKITRKIITIDEDLCNGCGQCIVDCAESALRIIDGKARLIAEKYCDGLGACLAGCPTGALQIEERQADDFDEEAVEELVRSQKKSGGCPSAGLQSFQPQTPCQQASQPIGISGSALSHWPVQIHLVPPDAPFLRNADLLIAADCTTVAYAGFHHDLLPGRVVLMGCPKFDDVESYIQKLSAIFAGAAIKSITIAIMEVPCCQNMRNLVQSALKNAKTKIPLETIVIGVRGEKKTD